MASGTLILRRRVFLGIRGPSMSLKLMPISSMPTFEKISDHGHAAVGHIQVHVSIVQLSVLEHFAQFFSRVDEVVSAEAVTTSSPPSTAPSDRG